MINETASKAVKNGLKSWNSSAGIIKQKNIEQLKALCKKEELKFLFNREGETCNYYIDGECSECKSGESMALLPEGGNGCCRTNSINECGYCEKCPDNKKCNTETKKCGECIDNNSCPGKQVCDDGVCVECIKDSDCQAADMHCTSLKKCEKCIVEFKKIKSKMAHKIVFQYPQSYSRALNTP